MIFKVQPVGCRTNRRRLPQENQNPRHACMYGWCWVVTRVCVNMADEPLWPVPIAGFTACRYGNIGIILHPIVYCNCLRKGSLYPQDESPLHAFTYFKAQPSSGSLLIAVQWVKALGDSETPRRQHLACQAMSRDQAVRLRGCRNWRSFPSRLLAFGHARCPESISD